MIVSSQIETLELRLDELEPSQGDAVDIARQLIEDQRHNGWVNYATWAVNIHLTNDEDLYRGCFGDRRGGGAAHWSGS